MWIALWACCNKDLTHSAFPEPVIPATMQVNGWTKWNRWHFTGEIDLDWNEGKPEVPCLLLKCRCMLSFLEKSFWQTGEGQLSHLNQRLTQTDELCNVSRLYRTRQPQVHCSRSDPLLLLLLLLRLRHNSIVLLILPHNSFVFKTQLEALKI